MNRTESLAMWARIARGHLEDPEENNEDLFQWIRATAARVIDADTEPRSGKRPSVLTEAIGLKGVPQAHADLIAFIEFWGVFNEIDAGNVPLEYTRTDTVGRIFHAAKARGLLRGEYSNDEKRGKDLIRSLLPE